MPDDDHDRALIDRYRSARRDHRLAVLEGLHALKHALRFGADILDVRTPDRAALQTLAESLAPDIAEPMLAQATAVPPPTFDLLAPASHPTGVIALARRPPVDAAAALAAPGPAPAILLERPTHHGNIGAAIRVAAAAGAAAVLTTGPHDPWHPTSLRGGAGLQFALPVVRVEEVPACDRPLVVVDPEGEPLASRPVPRGGSPADAVRAGGLPVGGLPSRSLLVFGSERTGVTAAMRARADAVVAIPMRPGVSSLNLATAVAAVLYGAWGAGR